MSAFLNSRFTSEEKVFRKVSHRKKQRPQFAEYSKLLTSSEKTIFPEMLPKKFKLVMLLNFPQSSAVKNLVKS